MMLVSRWKTLAIWYSVTLVFATLWPITSYGKFAGGRKLPRVVSFHEIEPNASNRYAVSLEKFIQILDWLKDNGYETLLPGEFRDIYEGEFEAPRKAVLLSFDDGYPGNYSFAVPELRKRGFKATFFVHTAYVSDGRHMTWKQLQELQEDPLFEVGSHTVNHRPLTKISNAEIRQELLESYNELVKRTGECKSFAYPNGAYDRRVLNVIKDTPYEQAFIYRSDFDRLVNQYRNFGFNELLSIPRVGIERDTTLNEFKYYVSN